MLSAGLTISLLASASIAFNYASRALVPIGAHSICAQGSLCVAAKLVSESTSAFFAGDLISQFLAGLLVRRVRGPWLLAVSTAGWALATVLTPVSLQSANPALAHGALQFARGVLCGLGYPSAHAVVATVPSELRATALGLVNAAAGMGMMLANVTVPLLLGRHSWELPFSLFGAVAACSSALLLAAAAAQRVGVLCAPGATGNKAGGALGEYAGWLREPLIQGLVSWMVLTAVSGQTIGSAFFPLLFVDRHNVAVADLPGYTGAPPLAQVVASLSIGMISDMLVNRAGVPALHVQARIQLVATVLPALSLLSLSPLEHSPSFAAVLATVWLGCTALQPAGAIAAMHAVGGQRAGELFVLGNAFAKLGALLSTGATRWALEAFGWPAVLAGLALGYLASGALLLPNMWHLEEAKAALAGKSKQH